MYVAGYDGKTGTCYVQMRWSGVPNKYSPSPWHNRATVTVPSHPRSGNQTVYVDEATTPTTNVP